MSAGRMRMWGIGLFLIGLAPIVSTPLYGYQDWPAFWTAGLVVGTGDLVSGDKLTAWQAAHGYALAIFPYPPAAAYAMWPFAQLSLGVSFWLHSALMLVCTVLAGRIAARVFGLEVWVAVLAGLAWAPLTGAILIGQNTPFALLIAMIAIDGLVRGREVVAGAAAGLLAYKPTLSLPFIGLFLVRFQWRALVVVGATLAAWYVVGIPASGGNVAWPSEWFASLRTWLADDAIRNADKAVSLPGLVSRLAVPDWLPFLVGVVVAVASVPRLARAPIREAAAGACLIGVAVSPHAWSYEAALLMPAIWWALGGGISEPWRTRLIIGGYVLAPFWLVSRQTAVSSVAIIVLVAAAVWLSGAWRGRAGEAEGVPEVPDGAGVAAG